MSDYTSSLLTYACALLQSSREEFCVFATRITGSDHHPPGGLQLLTAIHVSPDFEWFWRASGISIEIIDDEFEFERITTPAEPGGVVYGLSLRSKGHFGYYAVFSNRRVIMNSEFHSFATREYAALRQDAAEVAAL